ncbi:MAG: YkgJ family cysteine cluster protein [Desulfobacterium sp.]
MEALKSDGKKILYQDGFEFGFDAEACNNCNSRCCRGRSGNVWVNTREMAAICDFSGMNIIDGLGTYFIKRHNRFSIREKALEGEWQCVFLDSRAKCTIYPVRPLQCRQFPFWPHFKKDISGLKEECPGVVFGPDIP